MTTELTCARHRAKCGDPFVIPEDLIVSSETSDEQIARLFEVVRSCVHGAYTLEHHSRDVGTLSGRFALYLNHSSEESRLAELAGLLHDLGKIFTPLDVLCGTGKLTAEALAEMYRHPSDGADLILHPELAEISRLVRCHHEWPSGEGYPSHMPGPEIPPLARLISVVDWYAACRERRTYRPELSHEKAMELTRIAAREGKIDAYLTERLDQMLSLEEWHPSSSEVEAIWHAAP